MAQIDGRKRSPLLMNSASLQTRNIKRTGNFEAPQHSSRLMWAMIRAGGQALTFSRISSALMRIFTKTPPWERRHRKAFDRARAELPVRSGAKGPRARSVAGQEPCSKVSWPIYDRRGAPRQFFTAPRFDRRKC